MKSRDFKKCGDENLELGLEGAARDENIYEGIRRGKKVRSLLGLVLMGH